MSAALAQPTAVNNATTATMIDFTAMLRFADDHRRQFASILTASGERVEWMPGACTATRRRSAMPPAGAGNDPPQRPGDTDGIWYASLVFFRENRPPRRFEKHPSGLAVPPSAIGANLSRLESFYARPMRTRRTS